MIENRKLLNVCLLTAIAFLLIVPAYAPTTLITDTDVSTTTVNAVDVKSSHHVNATSNMFINGKRVLTTDDSTGGTTSTLYDVQTTGMKARDDDFSDFSVSVTTKPASPQYNNTFQASDIPSSPPFTATWTICLTLGGQMNGAGTAVNWRSTRNGVELGTVDGSNPVTSPNFWSVVFCPNDQSATAGDVFGVKIWVNAGNTTLKYATLYTVPRTINITATNVQFFGSAEKSGSVTGVTYDGVPSAGFLYYHRDAGTTCDPDGGNCDFRLDFDGLAGRRTLLKGQQAVANPTINLNTAQSTFTTGILHPAFADPLKNMRALT